MKLPLGTCVVDSILQCPLVGISLSCQICLFTLCLIQVIDLSSVLVQRVLASFGARQHCLLGLENRRGWTSKSKNETRSPGYISPPYPLQIFVRRGKPTNHVAHSSSGSVHCISPCDTSKFDNLSGSLGLGSFKRGSGRPEIVLCPIN